MLSRNYFNGGYVLTVSRFRSKDVKQALRHTLPLTFSIKVKSLVALHMTVRLEPRTNSAPRGRLIKNEMITNKATHLKEKRRRGT